MADKMTCPACDSHTSEIARAYREGAGCPYCGLPGEAMRAVVAAAERGASEQMTERAAQAEQRAATAEREATRLRALLDEIHRTAKRAERVDGKPSEWD